MKIFFLGLLLSVSSYGLEMKGIATAAASKELLYTEVHTVTLDAKGLNQKIETKYYKPNGEFFAEIVSDFSKNSMIPEVKFTDKRFEKTEELKFNESNDRITFKTTTKDKKTVTKDFKLTKEMAVGQGFDNFVKINFDQLKQSSQDSSIPLNFGVLSEMDFFSFEGYKKKEADKNVIEFGIKMSSFLLRMFVSELVLEYNPSTKQILSFRGLSNILTDGGKPQDVLIKYEYPPEVSK